MLYYFINNVLNRQSNPSPALQPDGINKHPQRVSFIMNVNLETNASNCNKCTDTDLDLWSCT